MPEQITMPAFIAKHAIGYTATRATAPNPHMSDPDEMDHWDMTINRQGRAMSLKFSTGLGHRVWSKRPGEHDQRPGGVFIKPETVKVGERVNPPCLLTDKGRRLWWESAKQYSRPVVPDLESVLGCLQMDAGGYDNARNFEDWAAEYGFDPDSRRALASYQTLAEQVKALRHVLGDEAYRELFSDVEPY